MFSIRYIQTILLLILLTISAASHANIATPNVMGLSLNAAKQSLNEQGLTNYTIQYQPTTNHPADTVIVQAPPPNTKIAADFPIRLIIAKAAIHLKTSTVPNLKGMSLEEAKAALAAANLKLGYVSERAVKMERIQVLYQTPNANQRIIQQRAINITLSDIIDKDTPRVKVILDKKHFKVGESTRIKAQVYNVDANKKSEYGFSINGRTYYSSNSTFQYTFKQAGHYIITASFRYARGTWYASLTKKAKVSLQGKTDKKTAKDKPSTDKSRNKEDVVDNSKETPQSKPVVPIVPVAPVAVTYKVPNVIGLSQVMAQRAINKAKLRSTLLRKPHKTANNIVLTQSHKANKRVKKETLITLTIATKMKKWNKPKAIIHPVKLEVEQGKIAIFSSHSTHDKSSKISRHWSAKFSKKILGRTFKIDTTQLNAGKYSIQLAVKDNKKFSDKTSAMLIIKAKPKKEEQLKIINTILSNTQLYAAILDEITQQKIRTNSIYINTLLEEAKLLEPLKYPQPNISHSSPDEATSYPTAPLLNTDGLDIGYIHTLLVEAKQTTDLQKMTALSEILIQQPLTSNKIGLSKVQNTENIVENQILVSNQTANFSWSIWIWLALILVTCLALISIIWSYRCKKRIDTLSIVYQYQNDEGKQRIFRKP